MGGNHKPKTKSWIGLVFFCVQWGKIKFNLFIQGFPKALVLRLLWLLLISSSSVRNVCSPTKRQPHIGGRDMDCEARCLSWNTTSITYWIKWWIGIPLSSIISFQYGTYYHLAGIHTLPKWRKADMYDQWKEYGKRDSMCHLRLP